MEQILIMADVVRSTFVVTLDFDVVSVTLEDQMTPRIPLPVVRSLHFRPKDHGHQLHWLESEVIDR